jgi:hypothetical protein
MYSMSFQQRGKKISMQTRPKLTSSIQKRRGGIAKDMQMEIILFSKPFLHPLLYGNDPVFALGGANKITFLTDEEKE